MSLQDISGVQIPATDYPYGSPQYLNEILPILEAQLQKQAQESNNARGMFYSGPAMANEQQAAEELAGNMAQTGAQQELSQNQLLEQQAFQQQLQQEAEQNSSQIANAQAKAGEKQALYGSAGQLGGMGLMYELMGNKAPAAALDATNSTLVPYEVAQPSTSGIGSLYGTGALETPGTASTTFAPELVPTAPLGGAQGAIYSGASDVGLGPQAAANEAQGLTSAADLGLGALGGLGGYEIGGEKGGMNNKIGGGLGGLGGFLIGNALMPGIGGLLGAGAGAFGGKFLGGLF